jgi:iron complex transport system substrate-binding protein
MCAFAGCDHHAERSHPATPQRIISLSPSTTEALFALGAGKRLVGRSRFDDYPPAAKKVPSVGGFIDPSYEAILGLAPDLVIGAQGPGGHEVVDRLKKRGIATYFPPTGSMAQIDAMLLGLARRVGDPAAGKRLVDRVRARRKQVLDAVQGLPQPKALLVFGVRPIVVAGPGGFPAEILRLAGAQNVVTKGTRYPTLGVERVLALDPDVVVDATPADGAEATGGGVSADAPGWKDLRALKQGHLVRITDDRVLRPGPRIADGLAVLARALHPEAKIP